MTQNTKNLDVSFFVFDMIFLCYYYYYGQI